jgi:arylsulfatase
MGSLLAIAAGVVAFAGTPRPAASQQPARPNIVLIMADDMGFSDIGPYGSEIDTPNLDRLAAQGLRFTEFYNTARCSPTRASLLTGLYPHQAGMGDMPDAYAARVRKIFDSPSYSDHLSYTAPTMAEVLRGAGYSTYMAGKWHLGYDRPQWPVDRGFDHSFTVIEGAMNYYGFGIQHTGKVTDPPMAEDGEVYRPPREGFFATDAWTEHAVRYIGEQDRSKPFFLYLAYNAPHWPLQAPAADIAKYRGRYLAKGWDEVRKERYDRLVSLGIIDAKWALAPRPDRVPAWESLPEAERRKWDDEMSIYAAQVERMDAGIGRVLDALRAKGMEENTLVIFLSDNGGAAEDPNRSLPGAVPGERDYFEGYGIRGAHVSSAPFRLTKKWVHEGGIATPLIVRWPAAGLEAGGIRRQPAEVIDLMPTFLDVSGASFPSTFGGASTLSPEGVSLLPAFRGEPLPRRAIVWEHEGNRAVREGKWKLVRQYPGPWELYDMEADRTELHDLAAREPERVRRMAAEYESWASRVGAKPWRLVDPKRTAK